MKSRTRQTKIIEKAITQQSDIDCSCELLDTSLSNVGDSDCSCSECLEANLQAFNELKELEEEAEKENQNRLTRRATSRVITNRQTRQHDRHDRNFVENQQKTKIKINQYKSVDRMRETRPKGGHSVQNQEMQQQTFTYRFEGQQGSAPHFSRESFNDYLKITQFRARQYLNERKKLENNEMQERQRLKDMIKQNLQALKFTVKSLREEEEGKQNPYHPGHKWNHEPYHCKSRIECKKIIRYDPDLENKKEQIDKINQRIKQYSEKNKKKPYQCPDKCPNHHMRTSKKKLAEIEKFIKNKAKKYEEKVQKQKQEKLQKQKVRAAKLRAIDIRCKDIVAKSKKYDPNIERTSFHNSIDHFSTFSELKLHNAERLQEKERNLKVKKAMNQKGGYLEEQIYQNLQSGLIADHPPIHSKIGVQSRHQERAGEQSEQLDEWCEKIVKDARIRPPKDVKVEDKIIKHNKREEEKVKKGKQTQKPPKKTQKQTEKQKKKEEERRKELQLQIQKKRAQILMEYHKRNTTAGNLKEDSKNKKIRQEYESNLKSKKSPSRRQGSSFRQQEYDPYRQAYKNQPTRDPKQMKVVGDPLLQQYDYHKNVGRFKQSQIDEDRQIFTKSGSSLRGKDYLKI